MKKIYLCLILLTLFLFVFIKKQKKEYRFRPATFDAVQLERQPDDRFVLQSDIFEHPFTYLGEGGQAYAFLSFDDRYVFKIFKNKHLKPKLYASFLPDKAKEKHFSKLLKSVIQSYSQAYVIDKEGCGLVMAHLASSDNLNKVVTVEDKLGTIHKIDLDKTPFLIQKKITPFSLVLKKHLDNGDIDQAQNCIDGVLALYERHANLGFIDRGIGVLHNNGFVENRAVHLDVGRFVYDPEAKSKTQTILKTVKWRINKWLDENYPEYSSQLT